MFHFMKVELKIQPELQITWLFFLAYLAPNCDWKPVTQLRPIRSTNHLLWKAFQSFYVYENKLGGLRADWVI